MTKLANQLASFEQMSRPELQAQWGRAFKRPAPNLSAELLRLAISYRSQEKKLGGLSRASIASLNASNAGRPVIKPGTRLVRSWNGKTITVEVEEHGFTYKDRRYPSLTAIAREVTGSHRSGPRFFGLRERAANG